MEAFASTQIDPAAGNHSDSARNDAAPTDEMARRPNCTDAASPMRTRAATVSAEGVGASLSIRQPRRMRAKSLHIMPSSGGGAAALTAARGAAAAARGRRMSMRHAHSKEEEEEEASLRCEEASLLQSFQKENALLKADAKRRLDAQVTQTRRCQVQRESSTPGVCCMCPVECCGAIVSAHSGIPPAKHREPAMKSPSPASPPPPPFLSQAEIARLQRVLREEGRATRRQAARQGADGEGVGDQGVDGQGESEKAGDMTLQQDALAEWDGESLIANYGESLIGNYGESRIGNYGESLIERLRGTHREVLEGVEAMRRKATAALATQEEGLTRSFRARCE